VTSSALKISTFKTAGLDKAFNFKKTIKKNKAMQLSLQQHHKTLNNPTTQP